MPQRLSASQLRRSHWCLRLLQYEVVQGRRPFFVGWEAARGNATHGAVGRNLQHRIEHGRYMPVRRIADEAAGAWKEQEFFVDTAAMKKSGKQPGAVQDEVIAMALAHARHVANDVVPLAVELEVSAEVPDVGTTISGRIDVVSRPVFLASSAGPWGETVVVGRDRQIRDLKTKESSVPSILGDDADQLIVYQLVTRAMGEQPADLLADYAWPKDAGKTKTFAVEDEADRTAMVVQDLRALIRVYETGLFPRTGRGSWLCQPGKCAHYDYCVLGPGRLDL